MKAALLHPQPTVVHPAPAAPISPDDSGASDTPAVDDDLSGFAPSVKQAVSPKELELRDVIIQQCRLIIADLEAEKGTKSSFKRLFSVKKNSTTTLEIQALITFIKLLKNSILTPSASLTLVKKSYPAFMQDAFLRKDRIKELLSAVETMPFDAEVLPVGQTMDQVMTRAIELIDGENKTFVETNPREYQLRL